MPDGDTTLEADVCIVGSGAGGGVLAGVLSERGLKAVVLEAGGYFDDADFNQLEIPPSLSTSGETLTIEESMTLRARMEQRRDVGVEHEWSEGWA
jgi:choline dehydrogenase-like flavoprotein